MDRTLARNGDTWTVKRADPLRQLEEDVAYWQSRSVAERVDAVGDLLLLNLKAQGILELPRLRRVLVRTQPG
jgi:hypothetical protein